MNCMDNAWRACEFSLSWVEIHKIAAMLELQPQTWPQVKNPLECTAPTLPHQDWCCLTLLVVFNSLRCLARHMLVLCFWEHFGSNITHFPSLAYFQQLKLALLLQKCQFPILSLVLSCFTAWYGKKETCRRPATRVTPRLCIRTGNNRDSHSLEPKKLVLTSDVIAESPKAHSPGRVLQQYRE